MNRQHKFRRHRSGHDNKYPQLFTICGVCRNRFPRAYWNCPKCGGQPVQGAILKSKET